MTPSSGSLTQEHQAGRTCWFSVLEQGLLYPLETCVVLTVAEEALPNTRWDRLLPVPEKASSLSKAFLFHSRTKQKSLKYLLTRIFFLYHRRFISPGRNLPWSWHRTNVRGNLSSVMWSESHLKSVTITYLLHTDTCGKLQYQRRSSAHICFSSHNVASPLICSLPGHIWPPLSLLMLFFHFRLPQLHLRMVL